MCNFLSPWVFKRDTGIYDDDYDLFLFLPCGIHHSVFAPASVSHTNDNDTVCYCCIETRIGIERMLVTKRRTDCDLLIFGVPFSLPRAFDKARGVSLTLVPARTKGGFR